MCRENEVDEDSDAGGKWKSHSSRRRFENGIRSRGKMCSMRFLDADVKRPLASVSVIVDEGNVVVFGQDESFIENTNTGQRIPMSRRDGVFVMRLDAQPCSKAA